MLIGLAISAIGMFTMAMFMVNQQKGMKNIEQLGSANSLVQILKLSTTKQDECKTVLGLDSKPINIARTSLP